MEKEKNVIQKSITHFLKKICKCNVYNEFGNNNRAYNIVDIIALVIYIIMIISSTVINTMNSLTYWLIFTLSIRAILKYLKKITLDKKQYFNDAGNLIEEKDENGLCLTQGLIALIFIVFTVIYAIMYIGIESFQAFWVKLLCIIYYCIYFLSELLNIVFNLFNATPFMYGENGKT